MKKPSISKEEALTIAHNFISSHNYHEGWVLRELLDDNDSAINPNREPLWEFLFKAEDSQEFDFLVCVGLHSKEVIAYCPFELEIRHTYEPLH